MWNRRIAGAALTVFACWAVCGCDHRKTGTVTADTQPASQPESHSARVQSPNTPVHGQASWKESRSVSAFGDVEPAVNREIELRDGFAVWIAEQRALIVVLTDGSWSAETRQHALDELRNGFQVNYDQPHVSMGFYNFRKPTDPAGAHPLTFDDMGSNSFKYPPDQPMPASIDLAERYRVTFTNFRPGPMNWMHAFPETQDHTTAIIAGNPLPDGVITGHFAWDNLHQVNGVGPMEGTKWDFEFKLKVYGMLPATRSTTKP